MKNLFLLTVVIVLFGLTVQGQSDTKLKVNNSTIYKVEKAAIWTTTLNNLDVITKFTVTSATAIYLNDKPALLSQLLPGFKVIIYYYDDTTCTSSNGCKIAVKILAYSNPPIIIIP